MEEGQIVKWLKEEGDLVAKGEALFEMETDKAVVEVEAPAGGVLLKILSAPGPVRLEAVVAWIGQPGEAIDSGANAPSSSASVAPTASAPLLKAQKEVGSPEGRIVSTPAARRRAAELGVNLEDVSRFIGGRRIAEEDVGQFAAARAGGSETQKHEPQLAPRKALIERLTNSWQSVPHMQIARLIDAAQLAEVKTGWAKVGVSVTDLLLHALGKVLPNFPQLTMVWNGDKVMSAEKINLAFAVDTERGVVAPVIPTANEMWLTELSKKRRELTQAARARRLRPQDLEDGVFTLTNLGMQNVDFFAPVISSPQTAILATGKIDQVPVVANGAVTAGWRMWANIAVDHRVADGVIAGKFLEYLQIELVRLPLA
jgi:pyruvate dehydrogenase E2 component (dihydrolipoamide acetyltransferase)